MLDIGEGTGALVVYTSETVDGHEIEIRPHGGIWGGTHTAVRARHVGDRVLHAGVFGSLPAGLYDLRLRHTGPDAHEHAEHRDHGDPCHGHAPHSHAPHSHAPHSHAPHGGAPHGGQPTPVTTVSVAPGAVAETTLIQTDGVG
jgi:hypothetical protein